MQDHPYFEVKYPWIFGTDVAGTVAQLGSNVTRFKIGDRVLGHCDSLITQKAQNAGFQRYSTCREVLVAPIPDSLPLANAAVLPLATDTAASALYVQFALPFPSLNPKPTGKTILIWGGSSSCGSSAIQLAVASGVRVITTAGKANFEYVKNLGAEQVFDHKDPDVVKKILAVLKPGDMVLDSISIPAAQSACATILAGIGGGRLVTLRWPQVEAPEGIQMIVVNGIDPGILNQHIGDAIFRKYLPEALAAGKFQAKPEPFIIKGGLSKVQDGIDRLRDIGVSAQKIVIEIDAA
ncbi:putative quinone oxidoreductase [Bisporella sp. PMI_857]|nr:putative quinone oxidoreductase [Bisporella sp. PMI_857]